MIETNFIHIITAVLALLGMGVIVGALKGIDWLISQKYQTISKCNECNLALNAKIDSNKAIVTESINKHYRKNRKTNRNLPRVSKISFRNIGRE